VTCVLRRYLYVLSESPQYDRNRFDQGGIDGALHSVRSLTLDVEEKTDVAEFDGGDVSASTTVILMSVKIIDSQRLFSVHCATSST